MTFDLGQLPHDCHNFYTNDLFVLARSLRYTTRNPRVRVGVRTTTHQHDGNIYSTSGPTRSVRSMEQIETCPMRSPRRIRSSIKRRNEVLTLQSKHHSKMKYHG
jgi:hypothetical protein